MPGKLIMNEEGPRGSLDLKKDRSQAQGEPSPAQAQPVQAVTNSQVNGVSHHGTNGLTNGTSAEPQPSITNGTSASMAVATSSADIPPALDQSWRTGEQNKSLGLLMSRVAQQCYYDLNKTLDEMSAIPVAPQQPQIPNGVAAHTGPDDSQASVQKKLKLMNFANDQRDRFIKTLVLSDWGRNVDDKARLIDVKVWLDKQRDAYARAEDAVARTKMNMQQAKVPSPNIEGAMEVLATGKASWVPDLGYIPPKRLTAKQLLQTLKDMNVTLATRLSLHEDLPYYFQDYSIADGRATFKVKDEFEVDLSIADEDPATQFYFIDIRLAFEPATAILDERVRGFLEGKVNYHLATTGLQGCYDFLHDFVLTHMLNTLHSQTAGLLQGKWFDCIKVEKLRRSLVVQYWVGMSGPKSWIEIGISSGKQRAAGTRRPATPHISVRWFQKCVEVKDEKLEFNWQQLDVEKCLLEVIEKHTSKVLEDLRCRITALAPAGAPFEARICDEDGEQRRRTLSLSLPSLQQPIRARIEPVTGQYSITPPSMASLNVERRLNNDPTADVATWLAGLPCAVVRERVRKQAELLGWTSTANLVRQDNLATVFGQKLQQFSVFTPSRAWGERWALAVTFSLEGEKWWVVELQEKHNEHVEGMGRIITKARLLAVLQDARYQDLVSRHSLTGIERRAVADVALSTLSTELQKDNVPYTSQKLFSQHAGEEAGRHGPASSTALFISFSKLMKIVQKQEQTPWANDLVRLTHHGVVNGNREGDDGDKKVRHDLRLSLEPGKLKELHKHIAHSKERDIALNSTGGLALRFITYFGHPFVREMALQLQKVKQFYLYATILKLRHFPCTDLSLSQLSPSRLRFTYNETPELSLQMAFPPSSGDGSTTLEFYPHDSNPHRRLQVLLEYEFNTIKKNGFEIFTWLLTFTLPLLQAFERLDAREDRRVIAFHPRTATWYNIAYHSPLPKCSFSVRARSRREGENNKAKWFIADFRASTAGQTLPEDLIKAVKELWKEKSEHWEGMVTGVVADAQGAAEVLERMDEIIRRFEEKPGEQPAMGSAQHESVEPPKIASEVNGNGQSKPVAKQAKPVKVKEEPDIIMLD